jgi:DNA polymerase III subunit epsilon
VLAEPIQTTLDQGVPLDDVTFCIVDLETTGGSPADSRITEIGAVSYRGGERLGTFQSLVNPMESIPPRIARLTGIDDRMVAGEPPIEQVLPAFLEFARGSVIVAHNARFDVSFLNQNLETLDYAPLAGPPVCTARLARRVVWPDVPNVKLRTLAEYFRTRAKPIHRALADAEACAEVLHGLLALAGRLGILTLGDLHEVVRARGRPNFGKIRLADSLPHAPGVYLFKGRQGQVLYVGKSTDLRTRVKSYFYGDERKKIENLLAEAITVDATETAGELEALVLEARLINIHEPPYNRRGKSWRRAAYLKLDPSEAYPRFKVVSAPREDDDCVYLGPFAGTARARDAKDAVEGVVPIRRCTTRMGARTRFGACALADMGRCLAPCEGRADPDRYGELVRGLVSSLAGSPGGLLEAIERQMHDLADQERFEQAALVRDRLLALADALRRARRDAWLVNAGRLHLRFADGHDAVFDHGSLVNHQGPDGEEPITLPCPRERSGELAAVHSWLERRRSRVIEVDVAPSEPVDGGATIARILREARIGDRGRASRDG